MHFSIVFTGVMSERMVQPCCELEWYLADTTILYQLEVKDISIDSYSLNVLLNSCCSIPLRVPWHIPKDTSEL